MEESREIKLPKNIKQIGEAEDGQKIYIEDYVMTYLKQMLEREKEMRVSVLYGRKEIIEDELYWFVSGAIEAETDFFMHKTVLDEESWQKVNELARRFFDGMMVLGWAVARPESSDSLQEQIIRTQKTFFRLDQKIYFEYITDENKEEIYLFEKGKFRKQSGYYVYYDKNECMQNYMVSLRASERHPEEFEADRAMKQIRENREEKRQMRSRRRNAAMLTCLSMILVTTIMMIGITMLNNYEKMESMEKVLNQISGKMDQSNITEQKENGQEVAAMDAEMQMTQENTQLPNQGASLAMADGQAVAVANEEAPGSTQPAVENTANEVIVTDQNVIATDEPAGAEVSADTQANPSAEVEPLTNDSGDGQQAGEMGKEEKDEESKETGVSEAGNTIEHDSRMVYIIQEGDTLATICLHYYGSLARIDEICSINNIENKDNIYYGQKIYLP